MSGSEALFTAALGLSWPWQVTDIRFEPGAGEIHFDIGYQSPRLSCPVCGAATQVAVPWAPAEPALQRWVSWARRCRLAPFKRLGATVRDHLPGILNSFRLGLSNGTAESINAKVQAAIARGRGFRTHSHLMTVIYLTCGKLTHLPVLSYTRPISAA